MVEIAVLPSDGTPPPPPPQQQQHETSDSSNIAYRQAGGREAAV